jgi:hypothetical protein
MLRTWEGLFEVYNFCSGSTGEITSKLEVHAESGYGHHEADEPVDQSETNGACRVENASGCLRISIFLLSSPVPLTSRKDTSPNHLVNIEKDNSKPPNMIAQRRVRFNWSSDSLLIRRFGVIAALHTSESEVSITKKCRVRAVGGIVAININHSWLSCRLRTPAG